MNIFDIQGLIDNSATIYTKIEILPKVSGESIITLTNENSVKSWVYSDLRNVEKQGFIGQFVARTLDGELQDISDDFNIEDREIVLYLGINSNHTSEIVTENNVTITDQLGEEFITEQGADILTYYKLGNFFVEKPESDEVRDNTKFKSMDYTILFNSPFNANYTDSEYTKSFNQKIADHENVTALWLAQYTCKQVGVVLGTTTFRNSDLVIDSNQFDSGYSCRDVIKNIAKLAITWARIGWDNKLYLDFDKQTNTPEEYNIITNDNYYELTTQKDVYGEVNRILMGSSIVVGDNAYVEDAQSIEDNGLTELDVYDNPILYTQELREQAITNASSMLGLMYKPVEMETTGHPWLLGNELITVVDMEGNYLNTYALDRVLTYNGHIKTKISSMAKTETESTYAYQGVENNDLEIKRSRVELDRQNQTLTSVMERTTTNESQISNINQNINGLNVNVTSMSGDINNLQGNVSSINSSITDINTSISDISDDISNLTTDLNGLSVDINDFIDNEYAQTIQELQDQIDGVIEFWTGDDIPTLNNAPASSWTTEALKQEHIGDVYIVLSGTAQGANYRFVNDNGTWKWLEISDSQIGAVRELAQQALNQANANALDIVDLQRTDVQFQADLDGITASYSTLNTRVNELGEGYDAITQAEKNVVGNPVLIQDCGEYLIKNLTIYGNMSQDNEPTPSAPQEIKSVTGQHNLLVRSNNVLNLSNVSTIAHNVNVDIENNILTFNGTSNANGVSTVNRFSLLPETYTISYIVEGESDESSSVLERNKTGFSIVVRGESTTLASFSNIVYDRTGYSTFTISNDTEMILNINLSSGTTYQDFKIKIQIEKGNQKTDYDNLYVEPSNYAYNLNELELFGKDDNRDYITYNITDETWYLHKYVEKVYLKDYVYALDDYNTDYRLFRCNAINDLFDNIDDENPCYSPYLKYKGNMNNDSSYAFEHGSGIYKNYYTSGSSKYERFCILVPTTIAETVSQLNEWLDNNNVYILHNSMSPIIEPITDNNLISDLNYIRDNAKLYKTHMVVQDTPVDASTLIGDIGINYLTDTVFNGIYASRSELKITQNSISTTVSETVNAVVENIDNRVTDVANTLEQNSKDLSNSINTLNDSLSEYAKQSTLVTVTNSVEEIQTALNEQILVTQQIKEDGVDKVTTTTGFTFDKDGLTIAKTGADTKTLVDEDGMTVYSTTGSEESVLLNVDSQGVQTENLHVRTYTQIGNHSRLQDYEDGTAIFYIE